MCCTIRVQCIKCHSKLHNASRHPAIRLSRRTTVTAAILPPTDPEKIGEVQKDAPRGVPNDRYYNLAQRSHLAISVQRRDSPRHQSPVFIITAQWRRHFTVGIHDPLQRRRPPTAQTGLLGVRVPSQTAIGANHPSTALPLQVWEPRGEREIWSDDHYNLNPIGGNQRRHPNVF